MADVGPKAGAELARQWQLRSTLAALAASLAGVLVTFFAVGALLPLSVPEQQEAEVTLRNTIAVAAYTLVAAPLAIYLTARRARPIVAWLRSARPATERERELLLSQPAFGAIASTVLWDLAAVLFCLYNLSVSTGFAVTALIVISLGGLTTSAVSYLLVERIQRPVMARALVEAPPRQPVGPSVAMRMLMAWALAAGAPLIGVVAVSVAALTGADLDPDELAFAALFLGAVALVVGTVGIGVAARSVAEPLAGMRQALARVERGELDAHVAVDDGSEVGLLQAGFNRMAAGLRERERVRDLFGRQVGRDVARAALDGELELGGEVRHVAALFVDLVASTNLAARRPPEEVVELLNRFFAIVVECVERHGGWVNKFEGDAALCVFGAPVGDGNPAAGALAAGRELRDCLAAQLPDADAGIGVSAGPAVAGNVGAEERFEYTVIGDPVNEAARLCELAKRRPERLLASEVAVRHAGGLERSRWALGEAVKLRGRVEPTRLATAA